MVRWASSAYLGNREAKKSWKMEYNEAEHKKDQSDRDEIYSASQAVFLFLFPWLICTGEAVTERPVTTDEQ